MAREPEVLDQPGGAGLTSPAVEADAGPEADGKGHQIVSVLTGLTGVWTLVGGVCYAILWHAYSSFFEAFGLTPQEVGYSRETLLIRAAILGFLIVVLLIGVLGMILIGLWMAWDHVRRDAVAGTALFLATMGIYGGLFWISFADDEAFSMPLAVLAMCLFALATGLFVGFLSRPSDAGDAPAAPPVAIVMCVLAVVLGNVALAVLLLGAAASPTAELVLVGVVNLGLAEWLGRTSFWLFRPHDDGAGAARPTLRGAFRRRRGSVALWVAVLLVIALGWAGTSALLWSGRRFDEGRLAVESGSYSPDAVVSYSVRPAYVYLVDPGSDPLRVCGDPPYAASLIAVEGDGWWVLLRPARQPRPGSARVVWMPRERYLVDLSPVIRLPGPDRSGGAQAEPEVSWQVPACR